MPELPEVETVRRGLEPAMVGARFTKVEQRRPDLRFPFPERFSERLVGNRVEALGRRAKYLLADLSSGDVLIMHLGMTGRFLVQQDGSTVMPGEFHHEHGKESAHDHVVFRFSNGATIAYNDVRRFGFMDLVPRSEIETCRHFAEVGIEPLGNELSGDAIAALFKGRRTPLKAALLDQRLIAGLGNIYVCEALFRSGLSPTRRAGTLVKNRKPDPRLRTLIREIRSVLKRAITAGGSTLRDYAGTDGTSGAYQHRFSVYDRPGEPCVRRGCTGKVRRLIQSGRSTFYCPVCHR
jgi:formamidopyrimidine-DNA glycosylase